MAVEHPSGPPAPLKGRDLRRHLADAVLPNIAFLVGYEALGVQEGAIAAVAAGLVLVVVRLVARRRLTMVFAAFGLVLLHVLMVLVTGEGRDYFLPWLVFNSLATVVFAGSWLLRRPISMRLSRFSGLTDDPAAHLRVTALWTGLWVLHLLVGIPLYAASHVVALGVAKFVLGPPAIILWGYLTWRLLRGPAVAVAAVDEERQ
jgi:intracellular septation protein A